MMRRSFTALVSAALVAVLVDCSQDPTIPKLAEQPIALTITMTSTTFRLGKVDTIRVTVKNSFSENARIFFNSSCQIVVTIRNSAGTAVVPGTGRAGCITVSSTLSIPANSSITQLFVWNGATEFIPPGSATPLVPGTYYVSATMEGTNYSTFVPATKIQLVSGTS